ncbi:hypothetical protein L484_023046 [Morus notabilis]|uniref:Uncharacterized protein n=1 Tax=Morus notabilis TaxID=981085 RepID=W9RTC1_9ROSA|nr:hypothetical protein L484_023046 [Morus notabilis]
MMKKKKGKKLNSWKKRKGKEKDKVDDNIMEKVEQRGLQVLEERAGDKPELRLEKQNAIIQLNDSDASLISTNRSIVDVMLERRVPLDLINRRRTKKLGPYECSPNEQVKKTKFFNASPFEVSRIIDEIDLTIVQCVLDESLPVRSICTRQTSSASRVGLQTKVKCQV